MTIESRAEQLLALIEQHRDARRRAILDEARERCAAQRSEAALAARTRMRDAFAEERRHAAERIDAARARLETRQRIVAQHRAQALLGAAWERLRGALAQRWADAAARATWVAHALASAQELLHERTWQIAHPVDWSDDEQQRCAGDLARLGVTASFVADARIRAGLGIRAGANMVDCTLEGLIADRAEIGARLLFSLESMLAAAPSHRVGDGGGVQGETMQPEVAR